MKKIFATLFSCFYLLVFFSCKSTSFAQREFEKIEPKDKYFITEVNDALPYDEEFKNNKFLFMRFYHINYDRGFKIGYLWRSLLGIMGSAPDGNYYSHAAINFDLSDNFVGATFKGQNSVKYEHVQDPGTNPYLTYMNGETTTCTVMAIPCTQTEWENCKNLIECAVNSGEKFKYSMWAIFKMPFAHKRNMRKLKNMELLNENSNNATTLPLDKLLTDYFEGKKKFICTGFIMKILSNGIASIGEIFEEKNIKLNGFLPADFFRMDGVQKLFTCRIAHYDEAVKEYLKLYPQFSEYFKEYKPTQMTQVAQTTE